MLQAREEEVEGGEVGMLNAPKSQLRDIPHFTLAAGFWELGQLDYISPNRKKR